MNLGSDVINGFIHVVLNHSHVACKSLCRHITLKQSLPQSLDTIFEHIVLCVDESCIIKASSSVLLGVDIGGPCLFN